MKTISHTIILIILSINFVHAQNITLSLTNAQITNDGVDDYYEADVMISGTTDFYLGSGQLYIDYNTAAFGGNVSANGNIEYSQPVGSILGYAFSGVPFPTPAYKDFIENDNTASRVSLSFQQNIALVGLELAPEIEVVATAKQLFHIKIKYIDSSENPNICFFSEGVFQDQFFTACGGTNIADCTNAPGTQITNDSYDCSGAVLGSNYIYNNGWTPSDPSGVSTTSDKIIIEVGEATISANTIADNIVVRAGAGLTVNSGVTLETISGIILESNSTSYASLISDGTITGSIAYERHVNQTAASGGNDLITPPVTGQSFTDFIANNDNIVSNTGNTLYLFGPFDKTLGSYVTYGSTESATLSSGVGYRAATTDNGSLRFEGTANQSTVIQNVFNSGPAYSQWNLVGNPYPSYLNVQDFLYDNTAILDATNVGIYGYDGDASDGWVIYNLNTTDANTVITPGQGFFVAVESDASIEFTPSMRRHGNTDDFIAGRDVNANHHLRLLMSSQNNSYRTDFYFNANSTNELDPGYDATLFGNSAGAFGLYSGLIEGDDSLKLAIQSLPLEFLSDGMVPLGLNANAGEQLTISIDVLNLPNGVEVYLLDTLTNTSTQLNTTDYVFTTVEDISGTGRFFIGFLDTTLSINEIRENDLKIYVSKTLESIVIKGLLLESTDATLFDINGKQVMSTTLDASTDFNTLNIRLYPKGIYLLRVSGNDFIQTHKILIN